MQKHCLPHLLILCLFTVSACQFQPTTPTLQSVKSPSTQNQSHVKTGPYHGPVSLKINTGLQSQTTGKVIDLSKQADDFQIQSVPEGQVVFSETFRSGRKSETLQRPFTVTDTSKRYTVHIEKHSRWFHRLQQIEVNLNGSKIIKPNDFHGQQEFATSGLLLNGQNNLQIEHKGIPGTEFTITVIETGASGTLLRRRGWEKDQDLTQADRLRNNDTNIFYPDEPDSLGDLKPYEGDEAIQQGSQKKYIGLANANQTEAKIVIGELSTVVKAPVAEHIAELENRFPVTVVSTEESFGDTFVTLKVELGQVELSQLAKNIQALNQREDYAPIKDVLFSSVNAAKTLSVATAIQSDGVELTWGVSLILPGKKHAPIDFNEQDTNIPVETRSNNRPPPNVPTQASDLWWLDSIKAREAWNYSLGQDAKIAVIDDSFGYIQDNAEFQPQRILLGEELNPQRMSYLRRGPTFDQEIKAGKTVELANSPKHGLEVSSILGASRHNREGIVGVAPESKILPVYIDTLAPLAEQLERLYNENTDISVINISAGRQANAWDLIFGSIYFNQQIFQGIEIDNIDLKKLPNLEIGRLMRIITKLKRDRNIIFVASAGNDNLGYFTSNDADQTPQLNFPSSLPYVISVGAYENSTSIKKRAFFGFESIDSTEKKTGSLGASNYGPLIDIWAPGKFIWTQIQVINNNPVVGNIELYEKQWRYAEGTSYAAPQVAGTIALMKTHNPSLKYEDVLTILQETGESLSDPSFRPLGVDYPVYGLNALAALQHPLVGAKPAKNYRFQITGSPGALKLEDSDKKVPGAFSNVPHLVSMKLKDFDDYPALNVGDTVEVLGWTKSERNAIANSTIEVLQLSVVAPGPTPTPSPGGFATLQSVAPLPQEIPQEHYVYNQINGRWVRENSKTLVETNQFAGLYFTQPIRNVTVKVGPVELPVVSVLQDLAVFGIPAELPAGVHDLTVEVDGQTLNINQAIEKVSQGIPAYLEAGPPPSGNPGYYNHANLSNVEGQDEARVYLNGTLMGTATSSDYNKQVDLDPHNDQLWKQDQRNQLCFELENRGGGYTYGFDLNDGDTFHDVRGTPGLHVVSLPDGQTDTRQGIVYRKCLTLNRFVKPVGSGGQAFWVKVFNLSSGNQFRFQGVSQDRLLVDTPAQIEHSFEMPLYSSGDNDPELLTSLRQTLPDGRINYFQVLNFKYFDWSLQAPENQLASVGIEVYRGINLVYRYISGQAGQWGTVGNGVDSSFSSQVYWSLYPNLEPPQGWQNCGILYNCY